MISTKENENDQLDLLLFPNPTSKSITLSIKNDRFDTMDQIFITDVLGKTIAKLEASNLKMISIDLKKYNLSTGQYFVKFKRKSQSVIKKFIVK